MAKYTIHYARKVQVRQYESLSIGLSHDFDNEITGHDDGLRMVADTVNQWIKEERVKL